MTGTGFTYPVVGRPPLRARLQRPPHHWLHAAHRRYVRRWCGSACRRRLTARTSAPMAGRVDILVSIPTSAAGATYTLWTLNVSLCALGALSSCHASAMQSTDCYNATNPQLIADCFAQVIIYRTLSLASVLMGPARRYLRTTPRHCKKFTSPGPHWSHPSPFQLASCRWVNCNKMSSQSVTKS